MHRLHAFNRTQSWLGFEVSAKIKSIINMGVTIAFLQFSRAASISLAEYNQVISEHPTETPAII